MRMIFKPLTESEAQFQVQVEEETYLSVEGNALASGDDALDKQVEKEIISRLHRGDSLAWCCITVIATWNGFSYATSLGACSLNKDSEVEDTVKDHGMREEALSYLNREIQAELDKLNNRITLEND